MKLAVFKLTLLATFLACALMSHPASAVGTRAFVLRDGDDFKGGDVQGVAIDVAGRIRAGFNLGRIAASDATTIWSALDLQDGSVLLGTGNEGKLLQLKGGTVQVVGETKSLVITSLAEAWGGAVVMGTLPDGAVKKWERGELKDFVTIEGVEHVWQVAFDPKSRVVFAATGPEGKLFRITEQGNAQVYFDAPEQHLMSVAVAPDGTVYAGASDKAKLYKVSGPGRATVLYDFGRTEVRAVAVADGGDVYAVANDIKPGSRAPSRRAKGAAGPVSEPPKTKGKGVLYRFDASGAPERLLDDGGEHFVSLAIGEDGKPYVGTGAEGRVYTVDESRNEVLVADVEARQISALLLRGKSRYVIASDPAAVHPVRGVGGADAVWTSKVLDAGLRAHFGRMSWVSTGQLELSTRSGNTSDPDDTWSSWSAPMTAEARIQSPSARYVQVRARWNRDPDAVLNEITIPFVTDNLRAVISQIEVDSQKASPTDGKLESSGGPIAASADTKVPLKWKVDNPDKDELRYRLQYRLVGTTTWYDMLDPGERLTKASYSWETADLPEGRYRVRVIVSDELSNPPDRVKRHELESSVVLVDNTPPRIVGLEVQGRRVRGAAVDGVGPIARIEIGVAGSGEWYPYFPRDGVFDEQREEFEVDVSTLVPEGPAILSIRVYDRANNYVVRNVTLK